MGLLNTVGFILRHPLNRHHKFNAISRWLRWQIDSRIVSGDFLFTEFNAFCHAWAISVISCRMRLIFWLTRIEPNSQ